MEFMEVVEQRTSVRTFLDKEVADDLILQILFCGHKAPTAGNIQPWEFIIIKNPSLKQEIVNTTFVGNNEQSEKTQVWMLNASVFIVVCADIERSVARYGKKAAESLVYLDCSACVENMLLAIVNLHLASCYVSGFNENKLTSVLGLPSGVIPVAVVPIGYPAGQTEKRNKRQLESLIHCETFGNLHKQG
ncbi:MAG TPA: nitroreductase family protein [Desulfosporosinus sp.]|nr:nitroreductase family protein [Desulfosporosinus sp.]